MNYALFGFLEVEPVTQWYTISGWTTGVGEAAAAFRPIIFIM